MSHEVILIVLSNAPYVRIRLGAQIVATCS